MEIVSRGPVPILNKDLKFDYEPRSVVQDVLGPLDRLPGLHVGQRWDTRLINPFTGQVDIVRVEVGASDDDQLGRQSGHRVRGRTEAWRR